MKTKMIWIVAIIIIAISILSCQKDESFSDIPNCERSFDETTSFENEVLDLEQSSIGEFAPDADIFCADSFEESQEKSSINIIESANSYDDIPTYAYRCYDMYKWSYQHVKQPTSTSCSWASYVICAGNVANAFTRGYPVNKNQVYRVMAGCNESKVITTLAWYANAHNNNYVRADVIALKKSTSSYLDVIKQMMLLLQQNKTPFVTIAKSGNYGHYLTVYSIHWKQGLNGSLIYFTDSLDPDFGSFNANVKSMDLSTFLYKMQTNSNIFYNFLRILPG